LFIGGGTYFDSRPQKNSMIASAMNMPGFSASPGSIRYLDSSYRGDRFNEYFTARHEIGHHVHAELRRLHDNINTDSLIFVPEIYGKARTLAQDLESTMLKGKLPQNFVDNQHRLISDSLMYSSFKKSLDKSILSSSERKRGELFYSMLRHASLRQEVVGDDYETVRILGQNLSPGMFNRPGMISQNEDLGRLLAGTFSRH